MLPMYTTLVLMLCSKINFISHNLRICVYIYVSTYIDIYYAYFHYFFCNKDNFEVHEMLNVKNLYAKIYSRCRKSIVRGRVKI